jgi:quercetin dioxygenase-like cupin family protein
MVGPIPTAESIVMKRELGGHVRPSGAFIVCATALCVSATAGFVGAQDRPSGPPVLFSAPLADAPGKQLVVVDLTLRPRAQQPSMAHRHPGSVYVYVTAGTARLGIEGQPVQEVPTGGSFFEPPGALHTVTESASSTEPAKAIAVMIVPEGQPLVLPAQ